MSVIGDRLKRFSHYLILQMIEMLELNLVKRDLLTEFFVHVYYNG